MGREPQENTYDKKPVRRSDHGYVNLGSGWRRPTEEFGLYGEAYHRAARELTRLLAENPAYHPLDACPIVFLNRHATELYLKGILRGGESLIYIEGGQPTFDASAFKKHPLKPLLAPLCEIFKEMDWASSYEEIASFVERLDRMDSSSFNFRYPVDTKEDNALPEHFVFDVLAFARAADACLEILYNASYSIDARAETAIAVLSDSAGDL
ncbi:MAG: hypothetical protein QOH06_1627 [Acidobacteriota bacterium]|jgi:hypothetical protein|nr:hypothetical protein [Acidobacteriota bacterium]